MSKLMIVVVLCVLAASLTKGSAVKDEMMKKFMEFAEQCQGEVGASSADVDQLIKKQPAETMEGKCLRSCIMKKAKVMDDNGKFVKAVALECAEKLAAGDADKMKIANEILDACASIGVSDNHCEAAEEYGKCMKDQAIAHGVDKMTF